MNLIERTAALYKAFTAGYDLPLLMKAANERGVNLFDRDFYQYLGTDQPVYMEHNATNYLTKGFAFNADVYSIINYRANLVASIPFKLYRKKGQDEYELIQDHPLLELANSLDRRALSIYEDTVGNGYIYGPVLENGPNRGKVTELNVLKADIVQIMAGGPLEPVKGYKYESSAYDFYVPKSEVLHFKNFNPSTDPHDSLYGMSPLRAAVQQISVSNDGTYSMNAAFKNQGIKSIVFAKDTQGASWAADQAAKTNEVWHAKQGRGQSGKVMFVSKELGKIDLGMSMVELDTLAGLMQNFRQLCNVFDGFPALLLNDQTKGTDSKMDAADKRVYTACALPRNQRYRDGLNKWLTPRYGADLWLDLDTSGIEVLQENKLELSQTLERAWWIKVNEKQKMMGVTEDPAMDFYMIPNTLTAVKDINDVQPPAQPDTSVEKWVKELEAKGLKL